MQVEAFGRLPRYTQTAIPHKTVKNNGHKLTDVRNDLARCVIVTECMAAIELCFKQSLLCSLYSYQQLEIYIYL